MFSFSLGSAGLGFENETPTETDKSIKIFALPDGGQGTANLLSVDGDYVMDEHGRPLGMSAIGQRVFLTLCTIQGSTADPNFGRKPFPLLLSEQTVPQFELIVREALGKMIRARLVRLDKVSMTISALGRVDLLVQWTDLTTRLPSSLPLRV